MARDAEYTFASHAMPPTSHLPDFSRLSVAVLGDLVADHWLYAQPTRLSREAPVMVLRHERDALGAGGAANVARNLRALGARVSLFGVDWFQKWPGGVSADHDWSKGSEAGQRCMWAAVLRFEAIMKEPPAELKQFLSEYDKWRGSFYNWVDDYSKDESSGDASHARLWAWRTGLTKWISGAAKDGSCYLPTRTMVVEYVAACKEHAASNDGEMPCSLRCLWMKTSNSYCLRVSIAVIPDCGSGALEQTQNAFCVLV